MSLWWFVSVYRDAAGAARLDKEPSDSAEVIGGFCVVDVPSREDALAWAAKNAGACRCAQEAREFMPDPAVGN
jgi:hypothetical protein